MEMLEFIGRHLAEPKKIIFVYNWQGDETDRMAVPLLLYYGTSEYYKKEQWLMKAVDVEDGVVRIFAVKDME